MQRTDYITLFLLTLCYHGIKFVFCFFFATNFSIHKNTITSARIHFKPTNKFYVWELYLYTPVTMLIISSNATEIILIKFFQ